MEDLYYRFVERLRQDPSAFSRNKNFYAFDDPKLLFARRVHRRLASLERRLLHAKPGCVALTQRKDGVVIAIVSPDLKSKNTSYLDHQEYSLLLKNPAIQRLLVP